MGYNDFFASNRSKLGLDGFAIARVISEHKGAYGVKNETGEYFAKITGKQMFDAGSKEDYPTVGDFVAISPLGEGQAVIHRVLPRKTIIKRKHGKKNEVQVIASNIDSAFVIESVGRDYNLNRLERYFAIAQGGGIKVAVILNKIDLISKAELDLKLAEIRDRFPDIDVMATSNITDKGAEELRNYIKKGLTYCFLGSSGVGKSSLINKLLGENILKTQNISARSGRGKHITTSREMYFLPQSPARPAKPWRSGGETVDYGGIVIDNPGMREVGLAEAGGIGETFEEIIALAKKCKYSDCAHTHEPGCQVLLAINSGKLAKEKYSNYSNLKKEADYLKLTGAEKRQKSRKFGKFLKKAKDELKSYGHRS